MFRAIYDKQYGKAVPAKLFSLAKGNPSFIQRLKLYKNLEVHTGCVNTICWSDSGSHILSGADDHQLVITCPYTAQKQLCIRSGHRANIFSAKFLPNSSDKQIVSCSGDGKIYFTEVDREDTYGTQCFDCHYGTAYEVITIPGEASTFLSCGEDGTVRWFDLRIKTKCQKEDCKEDIMINCRRAVTSLSVNPVIPYHLAVACSDGAVRIFDRRMLGTRLMGNYSGRGITGLMSRFSANTSGSRAYRITSLQYSPDGEDVLVNYSSEHLYLFSTKDENKCKVYQTDDEAETSTCKSWGDTLSYRSDVHVPKHDNTQPKVSSEKEVHVEMSNSSETDKKTEELATASNPTETVPVPIAEEGAVGGSADPNSRQPPIKRLRLRGDWSDTGPNARPESERHDAEEQSPHVTLMQRMSDMLTRWLDSNIRPEQAESAEGSGEQGVTDSGAMVHGNRVLSVEGATGGADSHTDSVHTNHQRTSQENPSLIQDLESMEIPSQPHCDITDTLRSLSKYHQAACPTQHTVKQRNTTESFQLSTSPCPVESLHITDDDTTMKDLHTSQTISASHDSSSGQSKQTEQLRCGQTLPEDSVGSGSVSQHSLIQEGSELHSGHHSTAGTRRPGKGEDWLEPIIDLHYSTQGTTSSTIQVGFAPFTAGDSVTNLPHHSHEGIAEDSAESYGAVSEVYTTERDSQALDKSGQDGPDSSSAVAEEMHLLHSVQVIKSDSSDRGEDSIERATATPSDTPAAMTSVPSDIQGATASVPPSDTQGTTASVTPSDTQGTTASVSPSDTQGTTTSVTVTDPEGATAEVTLTDTQKTEGKSDKNVQEEQAGGGNSDSNDNRAEEQAEQGSRAEKNERGAVADEASTSRPSTRQRRIGRSGPSTGDFQLTSGEGESSDEGQSETQRRRGHWDDSDDLERNVAAIRLQSFYRKKHAEREEREMESSQVFQPKVKRKFRGHRNARTMIKEANFWGDHFVMSGSDCGHIFMWDRHSTKVVMLLEADRHVVNCLQPHPFDPILASSGIDYDIKVWVPLSSTEYFDERSAEEIMRRNEVMLEETRDTITVPAAFMLRVLASLNHIRTGRPSENEAGSGSDSD